MTARRGFGLLEVVLATGILSLVVGASTALIRGSLRRTALAADRAIAMNLAQESIEQLRSARDSTYIDNDPATNWDTFLAVSRADGALTADADTCADAKTLTPPPASPIGSNTKWTLASGCQRSLVLGDRTFQREIYILPGPAGMVRAAGLPTSVAATDVVRKVHVIVRWDNNQQAVEASTYLTNWRSGL